MKPRHSASRSRGKLPCRRAAPRVNRRCRERGGRPYSPSRAATLPPSCSSRRPSWSRRGLAAGAALYTDGRKPLRRARHFRPAAPHSRHKGQGRSGAAAHPPPPPRLSSPCTRPPRWTALLASPRRRRSSRRLCRISFATLSCIFIAICTNAICKRSTMCTRIVSTS